VFSLATSSAASEGNFSICGFVHSKLRNCLTAEMVKKLVYIKTNYPTIATYHSIRSAPEDNDDGDLSTGNDINVSD
jgi:hAT family C-terminal dimerisation region